jgi:glyoxylase-like metal-dependent hydrolase (beta-lactamase superfamily II)
MNAPSRFVAADGRIIYLIPVRSFSNLITNLFVIDDGARPVLIDCGSGTYFANDDLVDGLAALKAAFGVTLSLRDISMVVLTHGHIDHYGGLPFIREHNPGVPAAIHILDQRVVSNHEERVVVAASRLREFLVHAGVSEADRASLMQVYLFGKSYYRSQPVEMLLDEAEPIVGMRVHHVPGHCPGLVCLQLDDILFTADHILSKTTPHQAPEHITNNMGLGHYFDSLDKIGRIPDIRLGLGSHEEPMPDIYGRIRAIRAMHHDRLERILTICATPKSIATISRELFGTVKSYHVLLALEEVGAHVEYLYDRGILNAANDDEIAHDANAVIQYVAT